jgi:hypothetical protein
MGNFLNLSVRKDVGVAFLPTVLGFALVGF